MKVKNIIIFPVFLLLVLAGCNTTQVTSSWSIPNISPAVMEKVLVVGIMADREERVKTEEAMVNQLRQNGINASSAFDLFGPKGFSGTTEEEITRQLRGSDYTSVMIVSLVNKDKELTYVPGTYYARPYYSPYDKIVYQNKLKWYQEGLIYVGLLCLLFLAVRFRIKRF
ncbi:MAG: hypothetical protein LIP05_04900 [Tannerellaceae bacterium]|nr:hypothetical protein [Tannerellaceae bacterium]